VQPGKPANDDPFDRKGTLERLAATITGAHGERFRYLTDAEKVRDVVHLCDGPIQVAEIQSVIHRLTRTRMPHSVVSTVLARGKQKGQMASPFNGVWLSLKNLAGAEKLTLTVSSRHLPC
jgi:hypothetical protein